MDAVEFLKEWKRMCKNNFGNCRCCPFGGLNEEGIVTCDLDHQHIRFEMNPERIVCAVEKWSKEHPRKTRMQDFLEKYPNAHRRTDGFPAFCPWELGYCSECDKDACLYRSCWYEPLEE